MVAVPKPNPEPRVDDEARLLFHGVDWQQYSQLLAIFANRPGLHITYLRGSVEIMTTGRRHEMVKTILGRLVEAWAEEAEVEVFGYGETTFSNELKERGLEPDECYTIGHRLSEDDDSTDHPDIAIEVIVSNPLLDKLQVYAGLGIPEVWTWRAGVFTPHVLEGSAYRAAETSGLLPTFDFALVARLAELDSPLEAIKELRRSVSETKGRSRT